MQAPKIRPFRPGDEPPLWQVYYAAVHQLAAADYNPQQLDAWAPATVDTARWAERIQRLAPFVAERQGQIIGYADLQTDGYIDHFFVAPDHARQGVGSRLMDTIHQAALTRGIDRLYAHVSITARPFFEKWGFAVDASRTVYIQGVALNNFRMTKAGVA